MISKTFKSLAAFALVCFVCPAVSSIAADDGQTRHEPLKISYTAKAVSSGKYTVTFKFDQNPRYTINLKPEPKFDLVKGENSILSGAKLVPGNVPREAGSNYYGKIEPINLVVQKIEGLQARFTYFFCSKKDGFCARKVETVDVKLP
ncbi:MAG TPA: hypothetical protein VGK99_15730 [Acidobacteriota bacterium]|jgi:hypothetical protein